MRRLRKYLAAVVVLVIGSMAIYKFLGGETITEADGDEYVSDMVKYMSADKFLELCNELILKLGEGGVGIDGLEENEKELVKFHKIQDDGHGMVVFGTWSEENYSSDCHVIYTTDDGGVSWKRSGEDVYYLGREISDILVMKNHVLIYGIYGRTMHGYWPVMAISHDYGATFDVDASPNDMVGMEGDGLYEPELIRIDEQKETVVISWSPYQWEENKLEKDNGNSFLVAEYDINTLQKVEEFYRNEYFYRISERRNERGFYFEDSSERYLTEGEILRYKNSLKIYNDCYTDTEFGDFLGYCINEIYYRKGYDFTGTSYEDYFKAFPGYENRVCQEVKEEDLNEYEKYNIDLLAKFRSELEE